jgi:transposase InsO family protein
MNVLVFIDRLSKGAIFEPCNDMTAEAVALIFIRIFYRHHRLPSAIVSDRGPQFIDALWSRVCQLLRINRRLLIAFHPETDGSIEHINQVLEPYLRAFIDYTQDDWARLLPMAELAINNRDSISTDVSPFFLSHGYHVEPLEVIESLWTRTSVSPVQRAEGIVRKLHEATE